MVQATRLVTATAALALLAGCGARPAPAPAQHAGWVIHSRVVFTAADLRTPRPAPPAGSFRLWFPFVAGALYGQPSTGDLLHPQVTADYRFTVDLNRGHAQLLRVLQPAMPLLPYVKVTPPAARIASLSTLVLQADGIDAIGNAQWVDPRTHEPLMLVYVDRAASITGHTLTSAGPVRYDIHAAAPGYIWVRQHTGADGATVYSATPKPPEVVLAVAPPEATAR